VVRGPRRLGQAGPGSQGPSHCPTPPRSSAAGGNPSPRHQSLPWGWGQAEGDWNMGPRVGPARWSPWPGRAGLWQAEDQPSCSSTEARADSPGGLEWGLGPWPGWGKTWRAKMEA